MKAITNAPSLNLFLFIVILFSCNRSNIQVTKHFFPKNLLQKQEVRTLLNKAPYFISTSYNDWEPKFIDSFEDSDSLSVRFEKSEFDTVKSIRLIFDKNFIPIQIDQYLKKYALGRRNIVTEYHATDTAYCYYTLENQKEKVFIRGEYNYKSIRLGLSEAELKFYRSHKDSLDRIRGTNLPRLPITKSP